MSAIFPALLVVITFTSAVADTAGWHVTTRSDKTTNRTISTAVLRAREPDIGVSAKLEIRCPVGGHAYSIALSEPLTPGKISGRYRRDDEPDEVRIGFVLASDHYRVHLIEVPPFSLQENNRLRIELHPTGWPILSYDFYLAGIVKTLSAMRCSG